MFEQLPTLELLFEQLGLSSAVEDIDQFIEKHQLGADQNLHEADFWTDAQREFLLSHIEKDDEWAMVIDELNQQLHVDSSPT